MHVEHSFRIQLDLLHILCRPRTGTVKPPYNGPPIIQKSPFRGK